MARPPDKRDHFDREAQKILEIVKIVEHQDHMDRAWRDRIMLLLKRAASKMLTGPDVA